MPKPKTPELPRPPKVRTRYSVGEWYGVGFEQIPPAQRIAWAKREMDVDGLTGMPCPFMDRPCNKKGGVCSLRVYSGHQGQEAATLVGSPVCVCPNRFTESRSVVTWVAKELLGTDNPLVLGEVGFLDRFKASTEPLKKGKDGDEDQDERDFIGRIDNVLIHPTKQPLEWCPLEIQAVYFSGKSMRQEFAAVSRSDGNIYFPAAHRRPDWRSSGPKRLLPQLQTKVPALRRWGRKMAVVIDRPFFSQLVGLEREDALSNADIAWFVVDYQPTATGWSLVPSEIALTTLEASVKALTGGTPLSKEAFERQLLTKLKRQNPDHNLVSL